MANSRAVAVAVAVTEEEIKDVEQQLKELANCRIFICGDRFWNYSVFDGMMLSDGHLQKSTKSKNARFSLSCKYEEFAKTFQRLSGSFNWTESHCRDIYDKRTNKTYTSWRLSSKTDERFTIEHKRWYPEGKKIVPKDLILDKTTLVWWYLGDGSLNRKKSRPNYRRVVFCTQGFTVQDVDFLKLKLEELFGNDSIYIEENQIIIAKQSLCSFIKFIGIESPVSCYQYKFDFGPYINENYWKKSFEDRPLKYINEYRKMNKVRELNYKSKEEINHG